MQQAQAGEDIGGMLVDDYSRFKWNIFLKNKNELTSKVMPIIEMIRGKGYDVKYVRMDNAGEDKSLATKVKSLGITVEYVAPNTPQHNGVVERAFAVGASRGRAIMLELKLSEEEKK